MKKKKKGHIPDISWTSTCVALSLLVMLSSRVETLISMIYLCGSISIDKMNSNKCDTRCADFDFWVFAGSRLWQRLGPDGIYLISR